MNKKQDQNLPWDNPRFRNWVAVAKAAHVVERAIGEALKPLDIKPAHLDMMMNIYRHPGLSQQDLAERLIVGRSNITMLMPSLITRGLVKRAADDKDKRVQRLTLTRQGTELLMQALALYSGVIEKAMGASTPEQCDIIGAQMMKIVEILKKSG
jgi:DNA-binding MarR family transcriptional regulator